MAKYELVKETSINGIVRYSIEKDGNYVNRSVTHSLEEAEKYLHILTINGGVLDTIKETIKTIEVNEDKTN
jgi:DNA gyrase/topoisomerase IV subunit A